MLNFHRRRVLTAMAAASLALVGFAANAQDGDFKTTATVDASDGLVINGEKIASKELLDAARAEGTFVLYTSLGEAQERLFADRFTEETGVEVQIVRQVINKMAERALSEVGAGRLGAQVIKMSDPPVVAAFAEAGIFQPYRIENHDSLDDNAIVSPEDLFYRVSSSFYTIGYNTQLVTGDDIPDSWQDLLDPEWAGKVATVNIAAGGSSRALARFERTRLGDDYLEKLAAQQPRIFDSASTMLNSIARGEVLLGAVIPARVNVAVASGAPVSFVIPEEGVSGWDFFLGLTSAGDSAAGKLYINWMMSKYAQSLVTEIGDYPARSDVAPPTVMDIQLPPLDRVARMSIDDAVRFQEEDEKVWYDTMNYTP